MKAVPAMRLPIGAVMAAALVALAQPGASAAMTEPGHGTARGYAEDLAQAAAKEFGVILERRRLAQAEAPKPDAGAAAKQDSEILTPLRWFHRSSREFQMLMRMLAEGVPPAQPWDPVADAEKRAAAQKADKQQARPPDKVTEAKRVAEAKAAEERKAAEAKREAVEAKTAEERKAAEAKRMAAEAKTAEERKAVEAKRMAAEAKTAEERKAAEAKRMAAEAKTAEERKAADAKRMAAEAKTAEERKAAEAKRVAAEAKTAEERKAAEGRRPAQPEEARAPPASATDRPKDRAEHLKCRGAGETIRAPGWYVVRERDTLSAIAWRHYGAARCYLRIHAANRRRIRNPHLIYPCQRIYLPRPLRRC